MQNLFSAHGEIFTAISEGLSTINSSNPSTMSAPRSLLRLFETEDDNEAMYGLPTPQASNNAFSFPIRAGSAPPSTTEAFNEAHSTANVNTIRLPSVDDDEYGEVSLNFNTDFAMGMETMRPNQSSPPRTATNFKSYGNEPAATSIRMPDADDDDSNNGFSWSFPSTPSGHGFGIPAQDPHNYGSSPQASEEDDIGTIRNAHNFNQHRKASSPVPFYTPNTAFAFPQSQTASPMSRTLALASPSGVEMPLMSSPSTSPPRSARRTASTQQLAIFSQPESDMPTRPGMSRLASVAVMERRGSEDHPAPSRLSRLSSGSDSSKIRTGSFLSKTGFANKIDVDRSQSLIFDGPSVRLPAASSGGSLRVSLKPKCLRGLTAQVFVFQIISLRRPSSIQGT